MIKVIGKGLLLGVVTVAVVSFILHVTLSDDNHRDTVERKEISMEYDVDSNLIISGNSGFEVRPGQKYCFSKGEFSACFTKIGGVEPNGKTD